MLTTTSAGCDPKFDPWQPPGAIIPTPEEMSILRHFFDQTNFVMPCVDEEAFWAALEEAKYFTGGEDDEHDDEADEDGAHAQSDVDGDAEGRSLSAAAAAAAEIIAPRASSGTSAGRNGGAVPAGFGALPDSFGQGSGKAAWPASTGATAPAGSPPPPAGVGAHTLARHANAYGFRVLFHIVLACGCMANVGQQALARYHYNLARAFLGPCMTAPSQHLVSALLIMVRSWLMFPLGVMCNQSAFWRSYVINGCIRMHIRHSVPSLVSRYALFLRAFNLSLCRWACPGRSRKTCERLRCTHLWPCAWLM